MGIEESSDKISESLEESPSWSMAQSWKDCLGVTSSRVRISPPPLSPRRSLSVVGLHRVSARQCPLFVKAGTMYYVYTLTCSDSKTYIGCTDDLKSRVVRHQKGEVPATKNRLPITLYSYFAFSNKYIAFNFEKYLKSGSGRAFMKKHFYLPK